MYMTTKEMMHVESMDSPEDAIRFPAEPRKDTDTKKTKGKMSKKFQTQ